MSISDKLSETIPVLITNGLGGMKFIDVTNYEYAFPRIPTSGTIRIDNKYYDVIGLT